MGGLRVFPARDLSHHTIMNITHANQEQLQHSSGTWRAKGQISRGWRSHRRSVLTSRPCPSLAAQAAPFWPRPEPPRPQVDRRWMVTRPEVPGGSAATPRASCGAGGLCAARAHPEPRGLARLSDGRSRPRLAPTRRSLSRKAHAWTWSYRALLVAETEVERAYHWRAHSS